jgi:hypothetical protein
MDGPATKMSVNIVRARTNDTLRLGVLVLSPRLSLCVVGVNICPLSHNTPTFVLCAFLCTHPVRRTVLIWYANSPFTQHRARFTCVCRTCHVLWWFIGKFLRLNDVVYTLYSSSNTHISVVITHLTLSCGHKLWLGYFFYLPTFLSRVRMFIFFKLHLMLDHSSIVTHTRGRDQWVCLRKGDRWGHKFELTVPTTTIMGKISGNKNCKQIHASHAIILVKPTLQLALSPTADGARHGYRQIKTDTV